MTFWQQLRYALKDLWSLDVMVLAMSRSIRRQHDPVVVGPPLYTVCPCCKAGTVWPCDEWINADDRVHAIESRAI